MLNTIHGWSISARAHVHTTLLYLRNGLTDCVQIWYVCWRRSLSTCFPQVMGGVGHLCTCARAPPSPYLGIRVTNCAKIWCVARDPIVTRFTRVGGGVTTFARASPVSLSRKRLRPDIEATPKTDLSLSRSLVHRQTWRLTGEYVYQISSRYLQKWLRYNIKHVKNRHFSRHFGTLPWFSKFCFLTDFDASKSVLGSFSRSLRKSDLKTCIAALNHDFFVWPFSPGDLRWPWPVLWSQSTGNDTYRRQWHYPCRFIGFVCA